MSDLSLVYAQQPALRESFHCAPGKEDGWRKQ
jgi:hypothetical protein